MVPIPEGGVNGLLPPFLDSPASEQGRSPYRVRLTDFVLRFGDTGTRRSLLSGLLDYRAALHTSGVHVGFQWVNGSFVEETSHTRREPRDIDVVTFFHLPEGQTQLQWANENPTLISPQASKQQYGVDAFTWSSWTRTISLT